MLQRNELVESGLEAPEILLDELLALRADILKNSASFIKDWTQQIAPERETTRLSLGNLAHYLALRRHDLRKLQVKLRPWGLSSLGRIEAQVLPNLDAVIRTLAALVATDRENLPARPNIADFVAGHKRLEKETEAVLGSRPTKRRVRIMVTLPSEAANDAALVLNLVEHGMNIARINCAHDTPNEWQQMIANLRLAEITTGQKVKVAMDLAGPKSRTTELLMPKKARVHRGDTILLTLDTPNPECRATYPIQVRCTLPEALAQAGLEERVFFDDGKIGTEIIECLPFGLLLRVTQASAKGDKLKNDKGINFPDTDLHLNALTDKDIQDLDFIVAHADIIHYSFVQTASDIAQLQAEIAKRQPQKELALVAKIETARGVKNLPELIAAASPKQAFGVMIARGDLAVELGFERLAEMQEEILWVCEAAHVPVIWATQVLESLAKKGRPSRAEVTDAAMSERAECVMLNKGQYILEALDILDSILQRMHKHQSKKQSRLRALQSW